MERDGNGVDQHLELGMWQAERGEAASPSTCTALEAQALALIQTRARAQAQQQESHRLEPCKQPYALLRARSGITAKDVATPLGRLRAAGALPSPEEPNALRRRP